MTTCPASVHTPTSWTYQKYGCRCPETVEARRRNRAREYKPRGAGRGTHRYWGGRPGADPYIDEIAVERACLGDPAVTLTVWERREAVRRLTEAGWSQRQIGARIGVTARTVSRWRAKLRAVPNLGISPVDNVGFAVDEEAA